MEGAENLLRNVSDTAIWTAVHRYWETERPNRLFGDPLAQRLAGDRGEKIAQELRPSWEWWFATRTYLIDTLIEQSVKEGVDAVINLAAGLDTRPYRMDVPAHLNWIEVDFPDILNYKDTVLASEKPRCHLERIRQDLTDDKGRNRLFQDLSRRCQKALILSEGLVVYLKPSDVSSLAEDLASQSTFWRWVTDLMSPGIVKWVEFRTRKKLNQAGAPFLFAPKKGPQYFPQYGWRPVASLSILKNANRLGRLGFLMRLLAGLPELQGHKGIHTWGTVCALEKISGNC